MVDYWLAGYFGRAWLWLRKGLRPRLNDLTGLSQMVARGEPLPASQLWQAQDFAVRVWWRFGMASVLSMVVVGIIAKAVAHGLVLDVAVGVVATLACLMAVAGAQVFMLRYRSDRTRLYIRKAGGPAGEEPLPPGSPGLPRRSDFWLMLISAVTLFGILAIAGLG
jgi:hypothetical protein